MRWMDNNHWKEKEDLVKEDVKHIQSKIKENETIVKALKTDLELVEDLETEKKGIEIRLETNKEKLDLQKSEVSKKERRLSKTKNDRKEAASKIKEIKSQIRTIDEANERYEKKMNIYEDLVQDQKDVVSDLKAMKNTLPKEKHHELIKSLSKEKLRAENMTGVIKRLKSHRGGAMCPIINEECDRISCTDKMLEEKEEQLTDVKTKINNIKEKIDFVEEYYELEKENSDLAEKIEKYNDELQNFVTGGNKEELEKKLKRYTNSLSDKVTEEMEDRLYEEKSKLSEIENKIGLLNTKIGTLTEKINSSKEDLERIEDLEIKNEKYRKRLESLLYIQRMFSKNGIPSAEIENAFQEVEDDINFILKELKFGATVLFSPDKELNKWEPVCDCGFRFPKGYRKTDCEECGSPRLKARKEELSLKIIENGEESDFEGDSGGGKTIISYAVRIALTMLKRRQSKIKLNMLFLDEVDSALDAHLASTITDNITKLLTKKLGYEQIIMVSHKKEIQNAVPHIIRVTKHDDYSTARFIA